MISWFLKQRLDCSHLRWWLQQKKSHSFRCLQQQYIKMKKTTPHTGKTLTTLAAHHFPSWKRDADRPMGCQLHCQAQAERPSYHSTVWELVQDCLHVHETTGTISLPFFVINFRSKKPAQLLHELPHSQEKIKVLQISIFRSARAEAAQRYSDLPPGWLKDERVFKEPLATLRYEPILDIIQHWNSSPTWISKRLQKFHY